MANRHRLQAMTFHKVDWWVIPSTTQKNAYLNVPTYVLTQLFWFFRDTNSMSQRKLSLALTRTINFSLLWFTPDLKKLFHNFLLWFTSHFKKIFHNFHWASWQSGHRFLHLNRRLRVQIPPWLDGFRPLYMTML
jgi:hypothetical protein